MPKKYRRYQVGGIMGLSNRARELTQQERSQRQVSRDLKRDMAVPNTSNKSEQLHRELVDRLKAATRRNGEGRALPSERERALSSPRRANEIRRMDEFDAALGARENLLTKGLNGLGSMAGKLGDVGRRASGGVIGFQQGGFPANYAAPQAYRGYGMPSQFAQRQEFLSPEVAQQYAAVTQGIMDAGTRRWDDVRFRGPQLAGFTDLEAAARAGVGAYGRGQGPQGTRQAASTLSQAARGIGSVIPEQEALARQYGTMAADAKTLGKDAAKEQERIAGLMEDSGVAAKTTGTEAETAFEGIGSGIQSLADTSAIAERGYGTTAGTLGKATELAQRGYGTTAGTLGTEAARAQRGYGTAADTATDTSLKLQREKAAKDYATQSAKAQRQLGTTLGKPDLQKKADLSQYMSQYTAGVTDPQLQQLMEFQKMQGQELGSQAAAAGAFGGSRADVEQRKLREQTTQKAADIIGQSQQEAFESAQQAFQADRAAQQQAREAALAAERGALAAETGQQATQLSAEQQALQQQMQQEQFGAAQEQAAHQTAMDAQRFGAGQEQAAHQARMDAERFGLDVERGAHQTAVGGRQANLAAQQAALAAAQQGRSQYEKALTGAAGLADVGTGRELQGYGTAADMMGGQQRAMSAGLGAYGQLAGIGGQQAQLGGQQQREQMARLDMMRDYGRDERQLRQAEIDMQKAEHQRAMQHPEKQIAWMNQQLGALPYQNIVQSAQYDPQAGPMSTMLGAAASGAATAAQLQSNQAGQQQGGGTGMGGTPTANQFMQVPTFGSGQFNQTQGQTQGAVPTGDAGGATNAYEHFTGGTQNNMFGNQGFNQGQNVNDWSTGASEATFYGGGIVPLPWSGGRR